MLDILKIHQCMVKENIHINKTNFFKDNFKIIYNMEKEKDFIKMDKCYKVIGN